MSLNSIYEKLKKYKEMLEKATLETKKIPDTADSADIGNMAHRQNKMGKGHMNGVNTEQYGSKEEKIVHNRVPKKVAEMFSKKE